MDRVNFERDTRSAECEDLATLIRRQGPLSVERAVELVMQVCEALAEAHALGIVHRDLKPSNVFSVRRSDGLQIAKVLDFGISNIDPASVRALGHELTTTAVMMGSPEYMSPERMRSTRDVDARTDLWGLGVIAFELLIGDPPFKAGSLPELAVEIATKAPPSPREMRKDVPRLLSRAVLRCLEKEPNDRFVDVAQLARVLMDFGPARARVHAERAHRVLRMAVPEQGELARAGMAQSAPARRSVRKRWPVALGLALLAWTAAVSAWWLSRPLPSPWYPPSTAAGVRVPAATVGHEPARARRPPVAAAVH